MPNASVRYALESIWFQWGASVTVGVFAIPFALVGMWWLAARRRAAGIPAPWAARSAFAEICMVVGTVPWIWLLLTPRHRPGVNLLLFYDLREQLHDGLAYAFFEIAGNLLVFAALGFCLPIRFRVGPEASLLVGLALSTAIEILQYSSWIGRYASIDDVLVNTTGAYLAAWLAWPWWRTRLDDDQRVNVRQLTQDLVRSVG